MIFLKTFKDLSERLMNSYVLWFRCKYAPSFGDIAVNLQPFYVTGEFEKYFSLFNSHNSEKIKQNTLLMCVGIFEHEKTLERYYIFRYQEADFIVPERLIIFLKIIARVTDAH